MDGLDDLRALARRIAAETGAPIDRAAYLRHGRNPLDPILAAGELSVELCSVGRDLGADEVRWGQPQVGAAGQRLRQGLARHLGLESPEEDPRRERVLPHVLMVNTVPYKPPGNRAYESSVREGFRPVLLRLLAEHWRGTTILALGSEAFHWFSPYGEDAATFWRREDRYEAEFPCRLVWESSTGRREKQVVVLPLPHPSPLNVANYRLFPELLARRLTRGATP